MSTQRVSINEIRERYAAEDIELSTDLTVKINLAISPVQNPDTLEKTDRNSVLVNFDNEEYMPHGWLEGNDWTLDEVAEAFGISLEDKVWEIADPG